MSENYCDNDYIVYAVIVLYYPNLNDIKRMIDLLKLDGIGIVIVENTPDVVNSSLTKLAESNRGVFYFPLKENKGIAFAQNRGIDYVRSEKLATHIFLLDQDTLIESGMIKKMCFEYQRIESCGINIAALAPTLINKETKIVYKKKVLKDGDDYFITDKVSSSGSLINVNTFNRVGNLENELFIDLVDSEWCWRAKKYNYQCCITHKVSIEHPIGEMNKSIMGYKIIVSAPFRYYYQYRNWIKMMFRDYVPIDWKVKTSIKNIIFIIYYPFFIRKGMKCFRFMVRGIRDGFKPLKVNNI